MSADGSVSGMKGWARIPMMGVECATSVGGRYGKHLAVKHPDLEVEVVGSNLYQAAVFIPREGGQYSPGRKRNSRGTAGTDADLRLEMRMGNGRPCESTTGF